MYKYIPRPVGMDIHESLIYDLKKAEDGLVSLQKKHEQELTEQRQRINQKRKLLQSYEI